MGLMKRDHVDRNRPVLIYRLTRLLIECIDSFRDNRPTSYGVRFDQRWAGIKFRYSWEIALSKN
jgi:hypothetical protein